MSGMLMSELNEAVGEAPEGAGGEDMDSIELSLRAEDFTLRQEIQRFGHLSGHVAMRITHEPTGITVSDHTFGVLKVGTMREELLKRCVSRVLDTGWPEGGGH